MKNKNKIRSIFLLALTVVAGAWTPASMAMLILAENTDVRIVSNPSPLGTSPVGEALSNPASVINVAGGGQILLEDYAGNGLTMQNPGWWNPGNDSMAYTTPTAGIWVEFSGLSVTGFTFNIGANMSARAWIRAYYDDGSGEQSLTTDWFNGIGNGTPAATPSYGVYAASGSCARITRVEIDPTLVWGIGNFGLAQADRCDSVPEPGMATLLGLGLMAAGLSRLAVRRRQQRAADDQPTV